MLRIPSQQHPLQVQLSHYLWRCVEQPQVEATLGFSDKGLEVSFTVHETDPLITATVQQEPMLMVCQDSAVELFLAFADTKEEATADFKPMLEQCLYLNIEINAAGICYAKHGHSRKNRTAFTPEQIASLGIKAQRQPEQKCWQISLCVPRELINELSGYAGFEHVFALNLYKISETAEHEHYVALNPINEEKPNFHLPQYFTLACAQDAE